MYRKTILSTIMLSFALVFSANPFTEHKASIRESERIFKRANESKNYTEKIAYTKWILLNAPNSFFKKGPWFNRNYKKVKNLILKIGNILKGKRDSFVDKKKFDTAYALSEMFVELICLAMNNKLLKHPKNYKSKFLKLIERDIELYAQYSVESEEMASSRSGREKKQAATTAANTIQNNIKKQVNYIHNKTGLYWQDSVDNMMSAAEQQQF